MVRTKVTPRKGEARASEDKGRGMHPTSGTCHTSGPPAPIQEPQPDQEEMKRRVTEAEWLEGVGGCYSHNQPDSWPRWLQRMGHLCWVGEPARKKLHPTGGGKAPRKELLTAGKLKKTQKY